MMAAPRSPGTVITFYSYKGGTGRTMALANVGCLLADRVDGDVLLIDFDLEAPGLHSFFREWLGPLEEEEGQAAVNAHPGLIEFLRELDGAVRGEGETEQCEADAYATLDAIPIDPYVISTSIDSLHLMKAGEFGSRYPERVNSFDWAGFYERSPWLMRALAERLAERYAYVLVDSRTGYTDSSGVCTMLLPEKLVVVFTPGRQSLFGVGDLVMRATQYRRESDDLRPLSVFPLPSRIDVTEEDFQRLWRHGEPTIGLEGYQPQFERLLEEAYALDGCFLEDYFDDVQLQHVSSYAYGEQIAVLEPSGHRLSLSRSYTTFTDHLVDLQGPWELEQRPLAQVGTGDETFVERAIEQELFSAMIERRSSHRVMTIRDRPGSGKSWLLRRFASMCRERRGAAVAVSLVSMAQFATSEPLELMEAIRRDLGGMEFAEFDRCVQEHSGVNLPGIRGVNRPDPKRSESCESAFRHDLLRATEKNRTAILFDDFDAARWELRRFIENLISRTVLSDPLEPDTNMVIVVAGTKDAPQLDPAEEKGRGRWIRVEALSPWTRDDIADYLRAQGVEPHAEDLELVGGLVRRGVPIGQVLSTLSTIRDA